VWIAKYGQCLVEFRRLAVAPEPALERRAGRELETRAQPRIDREIPEVFEVVHTDAGNHQELRQRPQRELGVAAGTHDVEVRFQTDEFFGHVRSASARIAFEPARRGPAIAARHEPAEKIAARAQVHPLGEPKAPLAPAVELEPAVRLRQLAQVEGRVQQANGKGGALRHDPGQLVFELRVQAMKLRAPRHAPDQRRIALLRVGEEQLDRVAAAVAHDQQAPAPAEAMRGDGLVVVVQRRGDDRVRVLGHEVLEEEIDVAAPRCEGDRPLFTDRRFDQRGTVDQAEVDQGREAIRARVAHADVDDAAGEPPVARREVARVQVDPLKQA
jgi:hypothetical protein